VALAAENRTFFLFQMATLAITMKRLPQTRLLAFILDGVTLRARLALGGFVRYQLALIVIDMMADIALLDSGSLIVFIVPE
jgi:hypothetical protein